MFPTDFNLIDIFDDFQVITVIHKLVANISPAIAELMPSAYRTLSVDLLFWRIGHVWSRRRVLRRTWASRRGVWIWFLLSRIWQIAGLRISSRWRWMSPSSSVERWLQLGILSYRKLRSSDVCLSCDFEFASRALEEVHFPSNGCFQQFWVVLVLQEFCCTLEFAVLYGVFSRESFQWFHSWFDHHLSLECPIFEANHGPWSPRTRFCYSDWIWAFSQ